MSWSDIVHELWWGSVLIAVIALMTVGQISAAVILIFGGLLFGVFGLGVFFCVLIAPFYLLKRMMTP